MRRTLPIILTFFLATGFIYAEKVILTPKFLSNRNWVRPIKTWGFEIAFKRDQRFEATYMAEGGGTAATGTYSINGEEITLAYAPQAIDYSFSARKCSYQKSASFVFYTAGLMCQPGDIIFADESSERPIGDYFKIDGIQVRYLGQRSIQIKEDLVMLSALSESANEIEYYCQYDECPEGMQTVPYLPAGSTVWVRAVSVDKYKLKGLDSRWFYVEAPISHAEVATGWIKSSIP